MNTIENTAQGASSTVGTGITLGLVKQAYIYGNTFRNLYGRAVDLGNIGNLVLSLYITGNKIVDVCRMSQEPYKQAIGLYSTGKLVALHIHDNLIINTSTQYAIHGISGNANVACMSIAGNRTKNIQFPLSWDSASTIDYALVEGAGDGSPEGIVRASVGSTWIDTQNKNRWIKKRFAESATGWGIERYDTAPPATGTWKIGDIIWNESPAAGGYIGWVCVADGTPGTWKAFGAIIA
jgi:hypothetical protein